MKRLNATDAKREFGEMLIQAQHEPIGIDKNGKPIAVLVSERDYHALEKFKEKFIKLAIQEGIDDLKNTRTKSAQDVFASLNKKINDSI